MSFGVAMISSVFYPSIGGAQSLVLGLSRKLRERGVAALVVTRHYRGLARYEEVEGVPTYRVGRGDAGMALASASYTLEALRLLAAERRRYDILHCHLMISPMTIGLLARGLVRKPLVVNPHGRGPVGDIALLNNVPLGRARLALSRRQADAFVSISQGIRDELDGAGVPAGKIWDISNGVDLERFAPAEPAARAALRRALGLPEGPLAIYAGRLEHEKGVDVLLAAWPGVLRELPDARLLILGAGGRRAALELQARDARIAESVIFAGGATDVAAYLRAADAFVLPSRTEGLPMALLEAMACGLPSVATAVGGSAQVIADGANGALVPSEDPTALAAGIARALAPGRREAWGMAARRHVAASYSLDAVADRFIQMYEGLLAARGGHVA